MALTDPEIFNEFSEGKEEDKRLKTTTLPTPG